MDVYCFCRRPDDGRLMVQCNQCDGWFHGECVGVTTQEVADLDQYICPSCMGDGSRILCLFLPTAIHQTTRRYVLPPASRCRPRKMRLHVIETHLHPLFLREVPCAPDIMQAKKTVLDWLNLRLLGPFWR